MGFNPLDLIAGGAGQALFGNKGLVGTITDTLKDAGVIKDREGEERAVNALMTHEERLNEGVNRLLKGQQEINRLDAASGSWWNSGWRPAIGWSCAAGVFMYYVPRAIMVEGVWLYTCYKAGAIVPFPEMGVGDLLGLTANLLGMSWLRSQEKQVGVARN